MKIKMLSCPRTNCNIPFRIVFTTFRVTYIAALNGSFIFSNARSGVYTLKRLAARKREEDDKVTVEGAFSKYNILHMIYLLAIGLNESDQCDKT